jgi:hypothetical protein
MAFGFIVDGFLADLFSRFGPCPHPLRGKGSLVPIRLTAHEHKPPRREPVGSNEALVLMMLTKPGRH